MIASRSYFPPTRTRQQVAEASEADASLRMLVTLAKRELENIAARLDLHRSRGLGDSPALDPNSSADRPPAPPSWLAKSEARAAELRERIAVYERQIAEREAAWSAEQELLARRAAEAEERAAFDAEEARGAEARFAAWRRARQKN